MKMSLSTLFKLDAAVGLKQRLKVEASALVCNKEDKAPARAAVCVLCYC